MILKETERLLHCARRARTHKLIQNLRNVSSRQVKEIVVSFLNKWQCRLPYECVPDLTAALQEAELWLQPLRGLNIEDADFFKPIKIENEEIRTVSLIERAFFRLFRV